MDYSQTRLNRIESQRSPSVYYDRGRRLYSPFYLIFYCLRKIKGFLKRTEEGTPPTGETELVPEFLTNLNFTDIFHLPGESVQINPEIFSAVSAGNKECMEKLRSYGKQMACLKSDQGDSILHLVAARGHLEVLKSIVFDCPCLLLVANSKSQLPLHVAAHAGHLAVVEALVATVKFVSAKLSEEERERLNIYIAKDKDGDTPLHGALKADHKAIADCLVKVNQQVSFLANKDGVSPLYLVVEAGINIHFVKEMLKTTSSDRFESKDSTLGSKFEGRKFLPHAALRAGRIDILDVILTENPSLEDERNEKGRTCLSFAASMGYYEGVCNLLDRSTKSVYVCDDDGSFPIHVAAKRGHIMIVKELLKRCPDSVNLLNKLGQNILHIAAKNGKLLLVYHLKIWDTTKYMGNEQDMDGNTPLHLAAIKWRHYVICILFVASNEKSLNSRNNDGQTALDIAESNLQPNYIFQERLALMVLGFFYTLSDTRLLRTMKLTKPSKPRDGDIYKEYINALLLVATLIATVTFAASFTIPGGFNSSTPNLGMAKLTNHPKLIYFLVFDTLAMQSSVIAIATLIWAQLGDPALIQRSLNVALPLLFLALLSMPMAFYYGVIITVGNVKGFTLFLNVTSMIIFYGMLFSLGPHVILQMPGTHGRLVSSFLPFFSGHLLIITAMILMKPLLRRLYVKISGKNRIEETEVNIGISS